MSIVSVAPLQVSNLRERARVAIRTSIVTGELQPGQLYTIGAFAQMLRVSATPVREALGDLEQVGLVKIMRNRGFVVTELTEHDLDEIFQLRLMLESEALVQVAGRLSEADAEACRDLVEQGRQAVAAGDLTRFLNLDREFHLRLIAPLGNQRLVELLGSLRDQTRLYGIRALADASRLATSVNEHEALLEAVARGDVAEVRQEIAKHLRHTRGAWAGRDENAG
jgi:DNA-binding GntR family transcriptional regulator